MSDNGQRQQSKFAETAASLPNAWKPGRIVRVGDTLYLDDGSTWIRLPDGGGGGVDALAELSDVDVSDAEEGDTLVLASGVWKASAPAGGIDLHLDGGSPANVPARQSIGYNVSGGTIAERFA